MSNLKNVSKLPLTTNPDEHLDKEITTYQAVEDLRKKNAQLLGIEYVPRWHLTDEEAKIKELKEDIIIKQKRRLEMIQSDKNRIKRENRQRMEYKNSMELWERLKDWVYRIDWDNTQNFYWTDEAIKISNEFTKPEGTRQIMYHGTNGVGKDSIASNITNYAIEQMDDSKIVGGVYRAFSKKPYDMYLEPDIEIQNISNLLYLYDMIRFVIVIEDDYPEQSLRKMLRNIGNSIIEFIRENPKKNFKIIFFINSRYIPYIKDLDIMKKIKLIELKPPKNDELISIYEENIGSIDPFTEDAIKYLSEMRGEFNTPRKFLLDIQEVIEAFDRSDKITLSDIMTVHPREAFLGQPEKSEKSEKLEKDEMIKEVFKRSERIRDYELLENDVINHCNKNSNIPYNFTQSEIAKRLGISLTRVHKTYKILRELDSNYKKLLLVVDGDVILCNQ